MFRRLLIMVLPLAMAGFLAMSCSHGAKVIPTGKMEMIYREMFLADEWLRSYPEKRQMADTTWFYEPVFEKYGYTYDDYVNTVDNLLNDPERFAELLGRVARKLESDAARKRAQIEHKEQLRFKADSIAELMRSGVIRDYFLYGDLFRTVSMTDTIHMSVNDDGSYYPEPVIIDTMYKGPVMILRDSLGTAQDTASVSTLENVVEEVVDKLEDEELPVEEATPDMPSLRELKTSPALGREGRRQVSDDSRGKIARRRDRNVRK